ncbi:hypothetical protein SAY86_016958 [Trapa natans]|uniref:LOB domain-containing protein n=1 Tax=Trapa natans TaxID=22666 RepID=A0AAN7LQK3_TRANT|nr:hypothetical protein SAY86_016958 [Trapa natans]
MSSSSSPCAACKLQRRKCTPECIFAPYFPADQPQKFAYIHKVFGASNVSKLLHELSVSQREDAVQSLAYEAETRLRDPVYGCVGLISVLQQRLKHLQSELVNAKKELAAYIGPQAMLPMIPASHHQQQQMGGVGPSSSSWALAPYNMGAAMSMLPPHHHHQVAGQILINEPQQQAHHHQQPQMGYDHQQAQQQHIAVAATAAAEQASHQEMYHGLYERQGQQDEVKLNITAGLDGIMLGGGGGGGAGAYSHHEAGGVAAQAVVSPSLALGGAPENDVAYQIHQPADHHGLHLGSNDFQSHISLHPQHPHAIVHQEHHEDQQGSGSDDRKSCVEGPSC